MATDATGTPTSLGIPKFNTAADAPSGLGTNAMMDSIDTLTAARVVKPSGIVSGEVPVWNGSSWDRSSVTRVPANGNIKFDGYGTSLPGSPYDGQVFTLVDSPTAPTYQWTLRYNAGSLNTDKWEYIGGTVAYARVATTEATASATDVDLATVGPSITVPRAGAYLLRWGALAQETGAGGGNATVTVYIGAGPYAAAFADVTNIAGAVVTAYSTASATLAASNVLKLKYSISNSISTNFLNRFLEVVPIRVS